jgi:uncharacterized membrane protein
MDHDKGVHGENAVDTLVHPLSDHRERSIGQKAADRVTGTMGSWHFIIGFLCYLAIWIGFNVFAWVEGWDPYPFILLNLTLSCVAALQAPIILMSQNRQTERDRLTAKYDYAVNRKAEREIRELTEEVKELKRLIQKNISNK